MHNITQHTKIKLTGNFSLKYKSHTDDEYGDTDSEIKGGTV